MALDQAGPTRPGHWQGPRLGRSPPAYGAGLRLPENLETSNLRSAARGPGGARKRNERTGAASSAVEGAHDSVALASIPSPIRLLLKTEVQVIVQVGGPATFVHSAVEAH